MNETEHTVPTSRLHDGYDPSLTHVVNEPYILLSLVDKQCILSNEEANDLASAVVGIQFARRRHLGMRIRHGRPISLARDGAAGEFNANSQ